eukprot:m.28279 g.28279  ORF g.28279 m.28279 type:complete len:199 (-) comp7988_c0_seq1:142-738(-)
MADEDAQESLVAISTHADLLELEENFKNDFEKYVQKQNMHPKKKRKLTAQSHQITSHMFRTVKGNVSIYGRPWQHGPEQDLEPRDPNTKEKIEKVLEELQNLLPEVVEFRKSDASVQQEQVKKALVDSFKDEKEPDISNLIESDDIDPGQKINDVHERAKKAIATIKNLTAVFKGYNQDLGRLIEAAVVADNIRKKDA